MVCILVKYRVTHGGLGVEGDHAMMQGMVRVINRRCWRREIAGTSGFGGSGRGKCGAVSVVNDGSVCHVE